MRGNIYWIIGFLFIIAALKAWQEDDYHRGYMDAIKEVAANSAANKETEIGNIV